MSATVKIQFELSATTVEQIEALMSLTHTATRKDYFNNALTLLEWAIKESAAGNVLASVDEKGKRFKELSMPIFKRLGGGK